MGETYFNFSITKLKFEKHAILRNYRLPLSRQPLLLLIYIYIIIIINSSPAIEKD